MRKTSLIIPIILCLIIGIIPLCAVGSKEEAAEEEVVVLNFLGPEAPLAMQPVIDAFNAANPGIRVEYEVVAWESFNDVLQTRLGRGDPTPDVWTADTPRIPALVHRGFLLDVTDEVAPKKDIFFETSIKASSAQGKIYAYPVSTSSQITYYNGDLLKNAGIDFPSSDPKDRLTWEKLFELAVKAQKAGAKWGLLIDQINRIYQIQPLPESLNGGPGLTGPDMLTPAITNQGWIDSLKFYRKIFAEGVGPRGVPVTQTSDLFANGEVAFMVGGPWWIKRFTDEGLNFGCAPHPYFEEGKPVTPTDAWSWGINPNSNHIEESKKFLSFATITKEGALKVAQNHPLPPAHKEVFEIYYAEQLVVPGLYELMLYEMENTAVHRPRTIGYIQYETIMQDALEDIRNGAEVEPTLEEASQELESAFSRLRK
jgi:multiple sugar transport system substrate-binding protein